MRRAAVLATLVVLAACSSKSSKGKGKPDKPTAPLVRVKPPEVDRPPHKLSGGFLLDDGTGIYDISGLDPLRGGMVEGGIAVPEKAQGWKPEDLEKFSPNTKHPSWPIAIAQSVSAERVGAIADAMTTAGRCLNPVVVRNGRAGLLFEDECPPAQARPSTGGYDYDYYGPITLTVFVQTDQVWVGISRYQQFQQIANLGHRRDRDRLETVLRDNKTSYLYDRKDAQLCGDTGVTYGDLIDVAMSLDKAGFTQIRFVSKAKASSMPQL